MNPRRRKEKPLRRRPLEGKAVPPSLIRAARIGLFLALPLLAHVLFPIASSDIEVEVREGEISDQEVIAPFTFPVRRDPGELERARAEAARAVPPVLDLDPAVAEEAVQKLHRLGRELSRPPSEDLPPEELRASLERLFGLGLSVETIAYLRTADGQALLSEVADYLGRALSSGIVDEGTVAVFAGHDVVNVRRGTTDFYRPADEVLTASAAAAAAEAAAAAAGIQPAGIQPAGRASREAFLDLVLPFLAVNAASNREETEQRIARARDEVPELVGMVHKGERILDSHERITAEHVRKIESMAAYRREMEIGGRLGGGLLAAIGRLGAISLLLAAFLLYLRAVEPRVYGEMRSVALLAALGVLTLLATYVVVDHFHQSELLAPVVLLPLLAAILLGRRVAVFLAFLGPVVLVSLRGFGPEFLVAATVAGVAAVLVSENLKHRHDLYVPVLVISGIDVLTIVTLGLAGRAPIAEILGKSLDGVLSSALVGVLASALLPIFEKSFRITTNFTLIDLLDRNHPLLKRMAMEAPGTFHHSMLVSELAREAAEVVGGNPLLAQVGAYYHDIGKMQMPEYFIENQTGKNRHDNLTPTMSCLILGAHVRDGIQMAREAGLPREIIAFIPEHHGTNLMSYFYHKAMDRDPNLEQQDFRYPGPEPHRKETAIVMLADSVEATARSIEDPTPGRIRSVVKRIIEHRAGDGQLDHSGLTLADLARVRDTFINVLDRFFHGRIQYPEAALRIRRPENGGRAAGPQGEEIPGRAGEGRGGEGRGGEGRGGEIRGGETRRPLRRGLQLPDGTESVVIARREEGEDASPGGGPAASAPGGEERAQDDRPGHARGR